MGMEGRPTQGSRYHDIVASAGVYRSVFTETRTSDAGRDRRDLGEAEEVLPTAWGLEEYRGPESQDQVQGTAVAVRIRISATSPT